MRIAITIESEEEFITEAEELTVKGIMQNYENLLTNYMPLP